MKTCGHHCWHQAEESYIPGPQSEWKCCQCGRIRDAIPGAAVWAFPDEHMGVPVAHPKPEVRK